jgi:hypothetical protein
MLLMYFLKSSNKYNRESKNQYLYIIKYNSRSYALIKIFKISSEFLMQYKNEIMLQLL